MLGLKTHRWKRIFGTDDRTLIVAFDHPITFGLMEGAERPGELIESLRLAGADAILTNYGIVTHFMEEIGDMGILLRVDGAATDMPEERGPMQLIFDVQDALRVGADAICSMGFPGSRFEREALPYLAGLVSECAEWNVPLMGEMLPAGFEAPDDWWTAERIGDACRVGAEFGVDFIKTAYTGDVESFRAIVDQLYVPVVVLGGSKSKGPQDILTDVAAAMEAGAAGIAMGRNIWRHESPAKMTAALAAVIHDGATVDRALKLLA
jgi:DhnA family fructose-bisphosphate aldolase class Ia